MTIYLLDKILGSMWKQFCHRRTVERLSADNEARDCVTSSTWRLSNSRMLLSIAGTDWLPCVPSSSALIGASDALCVWFSEEAMCYTGKMIVYYIVMTIHIV